MTVFTETWNAAFESAPADSDLIAQGASKIRQTRNATAERLDVEHYMAVTDGADQGIHKFLDGNTAARPASPKQGQIYLNTELSAIDFYDGAAWVSTNPIPSGTKMLFFDASAPVGWTIDTTHDDKIIRLDDTTGAGTGGTNAFAVAFGAALATTTDGATATGGTAPADTFSLSGSVSSHVLTTAESPAHEHKLFKNAESTSNPPTDNLAASDFALRGRDGTTNEDYQMAGTTGGSASLANSGTTGGGGGHVHADTFAISGGVSSHTHTIATHSHTVTIDPQFVNGIICTKD